METLARTSRPEKKTLVVLGLLLCTASSRPARGADPSAAVSRPAEEKAACLDAAFRGQKLRRAHKLVDAREQFRTCASAVCPAAVRTDCAGWVRDVEKALPTVVLSAKDSTGKDVVDVVGASVDDLPLAGALHGDAVPVDPGLHTFRLARADGSAATRQVLVQEGVAAQSVSMVFSVPAESAPAPAASAESAPTASPPLVHAPSSPGSPARPVGLVLGGLGIVAMGAAVGMVVDAKSRDNHAAGEPGMARQADSASAVHEANAATVVLGVGAAMTATGLVLWLTAPRASVSAGTDGREVIVRGRF